MNIRWYDAEKTYFLTLLLFQRHKKGAPVFGGALNLQLISFSNYAYSSKVIG